MNRAIFKRRVMRRPVAIAVQCRTHSRRRDRGEISDISSEGCCLRLNRSCFRVSSRLMLRPDGLEPMTGVVRWVKGNLAGVEFDRTAYGRVVDHLVARCGYSERLSA
ncbi:PilZ domain-containing protein [Novosphingobium sp. Rr 2-17]|uniref:PilZ domain-containing protein n=1 Tax=Novosphingobium sp. Rr 2-17 TaxID=555793 RepID=UPI00063F940C|nr:PilZ domain-containing protein [Novosphingobium sp. Rr 2-17]